MSRALVTDKSKQTSQKGRLASYHKFHLVFRVSLKGYVGQMRLSLLVRYYVVDAEALSSSPNAVDSRSFSSRKFEFEVC